jgi:hypothetical protein
MKNRNLRKNTQLWEIFLDGNIILERCVDGPNILRLIRGKDWAQKFII